MGIKYYLQPEFYSNIFHNYIFLFSADFTLPNPGWFGKELVSHRVKKVNAGHTVKPL